MDTHMEICEMLEQSKASGFFTSHVISRIP
jgi:hypothetical protein